MTAGGLGIVIYGIVLLVVTVLVVSRSGVSKKTVIILGLAWLPWLMFSVLVVLSLASIQSGGHIPRYLVLCLLVLVPLALFLGIFFLIWKWLERWRD